MYDDLLVVLSCELSERLLSIRSLLDSPTHRAKASNAAVARVLHDALAAVAIELESAVFPRLAHVGLGEEEARTLVLTLDRLGQAVRAVHLRLGYLHLRMAQNAPDIVARKLREDGAILTPPAICLSDDYDCLDHDVSTDLRHDLELVNVATTQVEQGTILLLPRSEAANPLIWTLLLGPLSITLVRQWGLLERLHRGPQGAHQQQEDVLRCSCFVQACLGGPAIFAAAAAHALFTGLPERAPRQGRPDPRVTTLALLSIYLGDDVTFALDPDQKVFFAGSLVAFYRHLLQRHGELLGRPPWPHSVDADMGGFIEKIVPHISLPTSSETASLFAKLESGTPINAISAAVPMGFEQELAACTDAAGFYRMLERVGERPASLATILSVGWLYKAQCSYALFRNLIHTGRMEPGGGGEVLTAYSTHLASRGLLLQQSLEAAYVHQIFSKWSSQGR